MSTEATAANAVGAGRARTDPQGNPVGTAERIFLLAGYALIVCLRMPDIVLAGRFWAEEGEPFFLRAWTLPWHEALLMPHGGYWNLIASGSALLARYGPPLEFAPYVTIAIGLLFQLCPAVVVLTSREPWLQRRGVLVLALLLLLTIPLSEEVWLQTLHAQFHLTIVAALILSFAPATGKLELFRLALLLLGALSGPAAAALAPLFALRAILDRSYARLIQAGVLVTGLAIQLLFFYSAIPGRSHSMSGLLLSAVIFVRHIVVPIFGRPNAFQITQTLEESVAAGQLPIWAPLIAACVFALFCVALLLRRCMDLIWLFAAGCLVMVVSYYGGLGTLTDFLNGDYGARYSYAPQAILSLVVLGLAATGRDLLAKVCWIVVFWLAVVGAQQYFFTLPHFAHGADWRSEVAEWRKDSGHALKLWPERWQLRLPAEAELGR